MLHGALKVCSPPDCPPGCCSPSEVYRCVLNMDEVASVSPRRRNVCRCPKCWELLLEPANPVYECPFCSVLLVAKRIPVNFRGESWQMPVNENDQGLQKTQHKIEPLSKSFGDTEQIRSQRQGQIDDHKTNEQVSIGGNIRHQGQLLGEVVSVVENRSEQELQLENDVGSGSTSIGNINMSTDYASKISTGFGKEGVAVDFGGKDGAAASGNRESQETQLLLENTISQLQPVEGAEYCSMPSASEKKKEFVGECECECDPAGDANDQMSQSEIIRDIDYDLSFKYISSALASNDQLARRERTSRSSKLSSEASVDSSEMLSEPLSDENSDVYEKSSASDSASHASLDSEFDFPSPSVEVMQPPNLSDLPFQQKLPLPDVRCDAPATPHQLEWQDVNHENEEVVLQIANGAKAASVGVDAKTASDVLNGVEPEDQVERSVVQWHAHEEAPIKNETFSVGPEDTSAFVRKSLHVQRENAQIIEQLANIVGSVDSKEGDTAKTEEDSGGYQGSHQLNKHKSLNDLQEVVSVDLLPSGAEHPSKLKSGSTLREGTMNASTVIMGTEPPLCSLSDGSDLETCLAPQENMKLINRVANVKLEDSVATIASENEVITGRASQSMIASQMIFVGKTQERLSDPSHSQPNMPLPGANNQSKRASRSSDMSTKRGVENAYLAQSKEPESVGLQSFPFVTEQGVSSSHIAANSCRNYLSEATLGRDREGPVNMFDSRLHHKRNNSEETRVQSELFNMYTSQVQNNMDNKGIHMSKSTRSPEGSSHIHQRHPNVAFKLADQQGPWQQKQKHQADMHVMQHSVNYFGPTNNVSLQPFGSTCYSNGSDSFARGVPNSSSAFQYQAPSHPWMLPVMPGIHYGCHSVAPVCMACIHCEHSHLPQLHMSPCGLCFNQPLSLAHHQGYTDLCNNHQAHQIQASHQGAPVVRHSPTCFSPQTLHAHDTAMAMGKPLVSSGGKPKHHPPLPRGSTAPYIICKGCDRILQVPTDIPLGDTAVQKLRCATCYKVAKFSVLKYNQGTCNAALNSTTTNEASTIPYTEHSRQPSVSNAVQSMDSSYHQGINSGLHPPYMQGSFDSQRQISAASTRRGSRPSSCDEMVQPTQCEVDAPDQGEFFFKNLSRNSEVDSSRMFFNGFNFSSSATGASNFDGLVVGNAINFQGPVDEKEEGLDFGAPRMSADGESLDQRSPESRMRSPENKQHFQLLDQKRLTKDSPEDEVCWITENMEHQALDLKRKMIAEGKKPTRSLLALLNQESSKFEINMEKRVSFDESRSVLCSTSSSSPMHDDHTNERSNVGDSRTSQPYKLTSNHFVRKGPRYVAGVVKRSLEELRRFSLEEFRRGSR